MNKDNPAFPLHDYAGLTKREYVAIQLLATEMSNNEDTPIEQQCIKHCIKLADDLFAELDK